MSRPVTADHILFNECISAFRPNSPVIRMSDGPGYSYLLTSFKILSPWKLPNCTVHPSQQVMLPGMKAAFISRVDNPEGSDAFNSHLYGIALSAIVTFITGRECKSTRDDRLCNRGSLDDDKIQELASLHPIRLAGPGANRSILAQTTLDRYENEISVFIKQLNDVNYDTYVSTMQAIRLAHLSQLNKREDFGLGYLLIVSAIEAIAQFAYKNDRQARRDPRENEWSKLSKSSQDQNFIDLLAAYKEARGNNVTQLYINFINTFAPASEWENITPHPYQDIIDLETTNTTPASLKSLLHKRPSEIYPSDIEDEELTNIIKRSYIHRSCFVHTGEQPPHHDPVSSSRFFQITRVYKKIKPSKQPKVDLHTLYPYGNAPLPMTEELAPNYELMVSIAKHSICTWIKTHSSVAT